MWKTNKTATTAKATTKTHNHSKQQNQLCRGIVSGCTIACVYAYQKHHIQNVYNAFKQIYWHILCCINSEAIDGTMAIAFRFHMEMETDCKYFFFDLFTISLTSHTPFSSPLFIVVTQKVK